MSCDNRTPQEKMITQELMNFANDPNSVNILSIEMEDTITLYERLLLDSVGKYADMTQELINDLKYKIELIDRYKRLPRLAKEYLDEANELKDELVKIKNKSDSVYQMVNLIKGTPQDTIVNYVYLVKATGTNSFGATVQNVFEFYFDNKNQKIVNYKNLTI